MTDELGTRGESAHRATNDGTRTDEFSISPVDLVNAVLRQRHVIVQTALLVFVLTVVFVLFQARRYESSASFMPQETDEGSLTATIAAQFGVSLPAGQGNASPDFYVYLVRSREILSALVDTTYEVTIKGKSESVRLSDLLGVHDTAPGPLREHTMRAVADLISVSSDAQTGLVHIATVSDWPRLSYQVTRRVLALLNRFNLEQRQSKAKEERLFVEGRLEQAKSELRSAEDALQAFLQENRRWQGSPELEFSHDRLQRQVAMRQQLYTSLMQAYEQARIDEVRNTPVITVVEQAEVPVLPERRRLLLKAIMALFGGALLGIVFALARELMALGQRSSNSGYAEFEQLKHQLMHDIARPWRLLGRWN